MHAPRSRMGAWSSVALKSPATITPGVERQRSTAYSSSRSHQSMFVGVGAEGWATISGGPESPSGPSPCVGSARTNPTPGRVGTCSYGPSASLTSNDVVKTVE